MESTAGGHKCDRHPEQSATTSCAQCSTVICRKCIEEFGYFCSAECLEESRASVSPEDIQRREREDQELRDFSGKSLRIAGIICGILILLIAWWLWSAFIAAPGKPAWTWHSQGIDPPEIVGISGESVLVLSGQILTVINAGNGKEQGKIEMPVNPGGGFHQVTCRNGNLFLAGSMNAFAIDLSEKTVRHLSFPKPCADAAISMDGQLVFGLYRETYDYMAGAIETPSKLLCYTFDSTTALWDMECEAGTRFTQVMTAGDSVAVLEETGTALARDSTCKLSIHDSVTGKRKWRLSFAKPLIWGPVCNGDYLAIQAGNTFVVVDLEGNQQWTATVSHNSFPAHLIADSCAYLQQETGEECRDLSTGKILWRSASVFDGEFLVRDPKRLIASGFTSKADSAITPGFPGAGDMNEILEDIGGGTGAVVESLLSRPVVTVLDPNTGERLWRRENISGRLYGTPTQLVAVSGTGSVNLLQMFSGGGGGTTIRQLSPKNGKTKYTRFLDFPFSPYEVVAGRLIGVSYDSPDGSTALMGLRLK